MTEPLQIPGPMRWVCSTCERETGVEVAEWWSNQDAAKSAAVWHAFRKHHDQFVQAVGSDRRPRDPEPELLGHQLAPWEIPA